MEIIDIRKARLPKAKQAIIVAACAASLFCAAAASAQPTSAPDYGQYARKKFSIGIAAGFERFDTTAQFTNKTSGRPPIYVDAEGNLGLEEEQTIPVLFGYWRIAPKHGLGFSYFRIRREGAKFAVDENFGDFNVTGQISVSDKSSFYQLSYNYTAYEDERALVMGLFGLYGVDLKAAINMEGTISEGGMPIVGGQHTEEINQFVPLPLVGVNIGFAITPRWLVGTKVAVIGGKIGDVRGNVFVANMNVKYAITKNLSLLGGFNFFNADVTIDKTDKRTDVGYGFRGTFLGVDVGF
jgi:hypothetical protein